LVVVGVYGLRQQQRVVHHVEKHDPRSDGQRSIEQSNVGTKNAVETDPKNRKQQGDGCIGQQSIEGWSGW